MKLTHPRVFLLIVILVVAVAAEIKISQMTPTTAVLTNTLFLVSEPTSATTYGSRSAQFLVLINSLTNVNALSIGSATVDNTEFSALDGVTATATAGRIPIANGSAKLDTWITTGSTAAAGLVELATDGEVAASVAVQGNDSRLTGLAVSKNSGATVGTRRKVNLIEGSNITLTVADDVGNAEVDVTIAASGGSSGFTNTMTAVVAYAATITPDIDAIPNITRNCPRIITLALTLTGNVTTLNVPTATPIHGDEVEFEIIQGGAGGFTMGLAAGYRFGTDSGPSLTLSTIAGYTDRFTCKYTTNAAKWDVRGISRGFN